MVFRYILLSLCDLYVGIIFVYILMSWIPNMRGVVYDIYRALGKLCDPFLNIFKKIIPPIGGVVDITPIIAIFVVQIVGRLIAMFIYF